MTEYKTHLIADEKLGGVKREYVEVERKAVEGDYIHITNFDGVTVSEIRAVRELDDYDVDDFYIDRMINGEDYFDSDTGCDEYVTLEPTDTVVIDGERYQLAERKAEVGEKVLIVNTEGRRGWYGEKLGHSFGVIDGNDYGFNSGLTYVDHEPSRDSLAFIREEDYRVLIPATDAQPASPDVHELLANLAHRLTSLERRSAAQDDEIDTLYRNVKQLGEELAAGKADAVLAKISDLLAKGGYGA